MRPSRTAAPVTGRRERRLQPRPEVSVRRGWGRGPGGLPHPYPSLGMEATPALAQVPTRPTVSRGGRSVREDGRQEAREAGVRAPTAVRGARAPSPPRPCLASRPACLLASALRTLPAGPHPGAGPAAPSSALSPGQSCSGATAPCAACSAGGPRGERCSQAEGGRPAASLGRPPQPWACSLGAIWTSGARDSESPLSVSSPAPPPPTVSQ